MATYFLHRAYTESDGHRLVRMEAPTVLQWFQFLFENPSEEHLRTAVYGFGKLVTAIVDEDLPAPQDHQQLEDMLRRHLYVEGSIEMSPHFIAVETDDDEYDIQYFFFNDVFLESGQALEYLPDPESSPSGFNPDDVDDVNEDDEELDVLNYRDWIETLGH